MVKILYFSEYTNIIITSNFSIPVSTPWALVKRSDTLLYITQGLMEFGQTYPLSGNKAAMGVFCSLF
jgi:hypothetical protein